MQYHQIDFMREHCVINADSVNLIISSVPLNILETQRAEMFSIFARILHKDGWALIDAPIEMPHLVEGFYVAKVIGPSLRHVLITRNMYRDRDQLLYVLSANPNSPLITPILDTIESDRQMSHICEFCPTFIETLIDAYSDESQTVLDPFCGTGTVPLVADKMGRTGIGCDVRSESNLRGDL